MEFIKHEKPLVIKTFKSWSSDKIYRCGIYSRFEECTCPWFKRHWKCKHITDLKKRFTK